MLTSYRVHLNDGTSYVTSMAAGITLEKARAYFVTGRAEHMTNDREEAGLGALTVVAVTDDAPEPDYHAAHGYTDTTYGGAVACTRPSDPTILEGTGATDQSLLGGRRGVSFWHAAMLAGNVEERLRCWCTSYRQSLEQAGRDLRAEGHVEAVEPPAGAQWPSEAFQNLALSMPSRVPFWSSRLPEVYVFHGAFPDSVPLVRVKTARECAPAGWAVADTEVEEVSWPDPSKPGIYPAGWSGGPGSAIDEVLACWVDAAPGARYLWHAGAFFWRAETWAGWMLFRAQASFAFARIIRLKGADFFNGVEPYIHFRREAGGCGGFDLAGGAL